MIEREFSRRHEVAACRIARLRSAVSRTRPAGRAPCLPADRAGRVRPGGRERGAWTQTIIDALAHLDFYERAARQAVARTAAAGWLAAERNGRRVRWQLTLAGREYLAADRQRLFTPDSDWMRQDSGAGRAASVPCGQPLVPTGRQSLRLLFFESCHSSWSPVTESNRRPSPYHACQFRPIASHQVGLLQVGEIAVSEYVALRLVLPGAVVTWFVTSFRIRGRSANVPASRSGSCMIHAMNRARLFGERRR